MLPCSELLPSLRPGSAQARHGNDRPARDTQRLVLPPGGHTPGLAAQPSVWCCGQQAVTTYRAEGPPVAVLTSHFSPWDVPAPGPLLALRWPRTLLGCGCPVVTSLSQVSAFIHSTADRARGGRRIRAETLLEMQKPWQAAGDSAPGGGGVCTCDTPST